MLGYHDSPYCSTDIWSPTPTRWGYNAIENRAFSPFCKHQQECEDIINMILKMDTLLFLLMMILIKAIQNILMMNF